MTSKKLHIPFNLDFPSIIQYLNIFAFIWLLVRCLFNFLPLNYWFEFGGYYLFFSTWIVEFFIERRWQTLKWNSNTFYFILLIVFFLIGITYAPFDTKEYLKHHIELRYPLIGFGIVGLFGLNEKYSLQLVFHILIIISTCAIIYLISQIGLISLIYADNRVEILAQMRIQTINSHMGFNLYLNFSLVAIWYICYSSWEQMNWKRKSIYIADGILIFSILLLSDGRSGFLASIILVFTFILLAIWKKKQNWAYFFILLFPICIFLAFKMHPRISEQSLHGEARLDLWKSAIELIEEKPILGYGISRAQEKFDTVNMKYTSAGFNEFWKKQNVPFIDTHNQYIQTTLEFGFIGLFILLLIYIMPIYLMKHQIPLALFCCFLYSFQSLFDIFITGQFCTFFCLIMLTLLRMKDKNAIFSPK